MFKTIPRNVRKKIPRNVTKDSRERYQRSREMHKTILAKYIRILFRKICLILSNFTIRLLRNNFHDTIYNLSPELNYCFPYFFFYDRVMV